MNEYRGKRREAARSKAKQSVAQRTHAPHTRQVPVHNTCTCVVHKWLFCLEVLVGVVLRPSCVVGCARGAFWLWYATRSFPSFFDDIDEVFSTDAACASPEPLGAAQEGEGFLALGSVYIALLGGAPEGNLVVASHKTTSFSLVSTASPTVVSTASWPFCCPRLFRRSCGTVYTAPAPARSLKSSLPASFPGYFSLVMTVSPVSGKSRLPSRRGEGTGHFF